LEEELSEPVKAAVQSSPQRFRSQTFASLRHIDYRYLWTGTLMMSAGQWIQQVTLGWLVYDLTGNSMLLGALNGLRALPFLITGPMAGVAADRMDRRKLLLQTQSVLIATAVLMGALVASPFLHVWHIFLFTMITGIAWTITEPVRMSMIPNVVPKEDLANAVALNSGGFNLARIVGPSIAAIVLAKWGVAACFGVNAVSYLAVLGSLAMVKLPRWSPVANLVSPVEQLKEGFRYIRGARVVSGLMGVVAIYSIFGFQYLSMMPVIARDVLHTGAGGYGLLLTFVGIGALTGALSLAGLGVRIKRGRLYNSTAYAYAGLIMLFTLMRSVHFAAIALLFLGLAMLINGALSNGIIQSVVPDALRGRVMSVYSMTFFGLMPLGALWVGAVAEYASPPLAVILGGLALFGVAALAWLFAPRVRALE